MYPFDFHIAVDKKERFRRRILYSFTALLLTAALAVGSALVYVNSCNMIYPEPIEIFSIYHSDDKTGIVLFGHFYEWRMS